MVHGMVGTLVLLVLLVLLSVPGIAYAQDCSKFTQPNMVLSWTSYRGDTPVNKGTLRIVTRQGSYVKAVQYTDDKSFTHVLNGEIKGNTIKFTYTDWNEVWNGRCEASAISGKVKQYSFKMWPSEDGIASQRSSDKLKWIPTTGNALPDNGIVGGEEPGRQLYICRAHYMGGLAAGKAAKDFNGCYISWRSGEYILQNHEVLSGDAELLKWMPSTLDTFMQVPDPYFAGALGGLNIYICRAYHEGGWHPGYLLQGNGGCSIGYGGGEVKKTDFDVLAWR